MHNSEDKMFKLVTFWRAKFECQLNEERLICTILKIKIGPWVLGSFGKSSGLHEICTQLNLLYFMKSTRFHGHEICQISPSA